MVDAAYFAKVALATASGLVDLNVMQSFSLLSTTKPNSNIPVISRRVTGNAYSDHYSVLMTFEAEIQASENNEDCVPVTQLKGYWRFTPKSLNRVLIEYETSADPAGDLPAWLANSFVVDQPYGTLKKLKQRVENNSYTLPEEMAFIKAKASD